MTPNGNPSPKLKIPCANNTCGFDPHHRHKKKLPQLVWGSFLFICGVCAGRTARPCLAGRAISPAGCRSVRGRPPPPVTSPSSSGEVLFYLRRVRGSNSTARISDREHHGLGVHIKTEKQKLPRKNTVRQLLLFICRVPPACADSSIPPYSTPAEGRFCPLYLWLLCCPAFPGRTVCFAEKAYSGPEKAPKCGSDHLFCRFLPLLQCFL